jgi:glycosyltransferase involved in cell wall biosynthesis
VLFAPDLVLRPASPPDDAALCKAKRDIVVYNCIEDPVSMVPESIRKWPEGELSFAFVGAITEDKGVFDLVEIARILRDKGYGFTMSLVGEGNLKEITRLKALIGRYGLAECVQLTGVLIGEQKFKLLQQTTIFLFPTYFRAETQPTVLMEALAVGVPVVAYDWRGINTIIDQGENGYMVPPRDVEAFCRAIETILTGGKIDRMRTAARRIYLERFTLDRHVGALMRAFQSLHMEGFEECDQKGNIGAT